MGLSKFDKYKNENKKIIKLECPDCKEVAVVSDTGLLIRKPLDATFYSCEKCKQGFVRYWRDPDKKLIKN